MSVRTIRRPGTLAVYNHHGADVVVRIESYRDVNEFGDVAYTVSTTPSGYVLPAPIAADRLADPDADQVRRAAAVLRPARDARRGDEVLGPDGWVVIDGTEPRREWPFSHLRFITRTPRDFHRPADAEVWIVRTP